MVDNIIDLDPEAFQFINFAYAVRGYSFDRLLCCNSKLIAHMAILRPSRYGSSAMVHQILSISI